MREKTHFLASKQGWLDRVVNQMDMFAMLVWVGLVFIGLGGSLYFYHHGAIASRINKYRRVNPSPAKPGSREAYEEQRFYEELVRIENGPSRFSLTIAMVTLLLMLGFALSAIISTFVR